jgi:S1-C subfamily serine protease
MKQIDILLVDIYSEYKPLTEEEYLKNKMENKTIFDANITNQLSSIRFNEKPFAKVDEILEGSPAELAGLQDNDILLSFGKVSNDINDIPSVVKEFINKPILLNIRRNNENIQCHITPTSWLGRGLLGCHILKYIE